MLQIIETADGSNTIYNPQVGENYHSKHGALQESRHVFINAGLAYFLEIRNYPPAVSILEVGFGTGLNFLLSADFCSGNKVCLDYTGIEAYPLALEMIADTGYQQYISKTNWAKFIEHYQEALSGRVMLNSNCELRIAYTQLTDFGSVEQYDIIYFDAFGRASQPEMWMDGIIAHTTQFLKPGGVFVTYAITGDLKRALKILGFKVKNYPVHRVNVKCCGPLNCKYKEL
jgi:tRNA U34 5-methylaminomethyl-2-thiouridine-forming methyltransferase MnmC